MLTDTDLEKLRDQGPEPEVPPVDTIARRAGDVNRRARRRHLAAVAAIAAVIVAAAVAEPWSRQMHQGVAGADVLAAVANPGCEGSARRSTAAEADSVRFLPEYVPSGFTIAEAFANHFTDEPCFRFIARVVYTKRAAADAVGATLAISTGSEPAARVDCGSGNAPAPVDDPGAFQRCVLVRGRTAALVHVLDTTSVTWIEPDLGAVSFRATALMPDTVVDLVNELAAPGDGTITLPAAAVPAGYGLAYEDWRPVGHLQIHDDFRATFVREHGLVDDATPQLWVSVSPTHRSLWALFLGIEPFELVHVEGHDGLMYETEGGVSVNWKVGDNLFSVNTPPGISREEALRVARSFGPVPRDDARLVDPSTHD